MTAQGVGELCSVTSRMNSVEYIRIMEEVLLPTVKIAMGDPQEPLRFVLMQVFQYFRISVLFFTINYIFLF
jgi:hypothetical protein